MRRPLTSLTALATASVLALAACAGGSSPQSGAGAGAGTQEEGPLDAYFSALWSQEEWTQERMDEENLQREELIAQCMAKEGFEYIPNTNSGGTVWSGDDYDGPAWDSLEFAQKYGYGVVEWPGSSEMEEAANFEEYVDPNQGYIESLSESEQQAFHETLWGAPQDYEEPLDGEEENFEYSWEDNGCWGWAENEINSSNSAANAWEDPEFEELFSAMEELWNVGVDSPDMIAANQEWAACMEESGFPGFATPDDAMTSMYEQQNQIYEDASTDGEEWVEPDRALFDALQAEEIAMATADWKCKDKVNYVTRQQKVDFQAQQEFVDTHREQLDALVAKYATKSKSS